MVPTSRPGGPTAAATASSSFYTAAMKSSRISPDTMTSPTTFPAPSTIPTGTGAATGPGTVVYGAGAFDSGHNVDVMFTPAGGTWTWNGTNWTQQSPTAAPAALTAPSMAYDSATSTTILFGGDATGGLQNGTWSWNGTNWTHLTPATSPPARDFASMAYDAALGKIILFGGYNGTTAVNDTWAWNGTTWTSVTTPSGLTGRDDASFAYDSTASNLVLYGGVSGSTYYEDTWLYGASGWTDASPAHDPGAMAGVGLAFDSTLGRVLMVGGTDGSSTYNYESLWNGTDWEEGIAENYPSYRSDGVFLPAPTGYGQNFEYGGTDNAGTNYSDGYVLDWGSLGTPPNATFETHAESSTQTYGVNPANGNLVFSGTDIDIPGPGQDLKVTRITQTLSDFQGWAGIASELTNGFDSWWGAEPDGSLVVDGIRGLSDMLYFHKSGSTFIAPPGANATLATSGTGYTFTFNSTGETLTFNSSHELVTDATRNGNTITYGWSSGQPASITDAAGRNVTVTMGNGTVGTVGFIHAITVPGGAYAEYDENDDYLTGFWDMNHTFFQYGYPDNSSLLTEFESGNGVATETNLAYDAADRVAQITFPTSTPNTQNYTYTNPAAGTTSPTYWEQGASEDPNSHTTTYQTNYAGQAVKVTDALGHSRSTTYTSNGAIATSVDAIGSGNTTTYGYDALNNPVSATLPTGAATTAAYASSSSCSTTDTIHPYLPKCSKDAQGNQNTFTYDTPGNLTQQKNTTTGATLTYTYNPSTPTCGGKVGQVCTSKDGNGNLTSYTYDSSVNLTTITPPSPLAATTQTFDSLGRVASVTDGKGQKTSYTYNGNNQVTQQLSNGATSCTYSSGNCTTFGYDYNGNLHTQENKLGTTTYSYDNMNRQTDVNSPVGDPNIYEKYDPAGNVSAYQDSGGTVNYTYNAANQLVSLAEPGGSCSGTISGCTTFANDNNGNRLTTTYPGGTVMTSTLDASGRTTEIKTINSASTVLTDYHYTYTSSGSDTEAVQTRTDTSGKVTTYGYDAKNELTSAVEKSSGTTTAAWTYCYDAAGNRTAVSTATSTGAACTTTPTTSYTYNGANELTALNGSSTGWSYDADGNETAGNSSTPRTSEQYTPTNALQSITTGGSATAMTYNSSGNNARVTSGGTSYILGPEGIAGQFSTSTNSRFVHDPSGTLVAENTASTSYYYLFDGQGSVIGLVNSSGTLVDTYSYDPYGVVRTHTGTVANPFGYIAGYTDTTGLVKFGARYYDPTSGRFTQPDPSGQESNLYAYVGCNPVNAVDPSGLSASGCAKAIIGEVAASLGLVGTAIGIVASLALELPSVGLSTVLGVASTLGFIGSAYGVVDAIASIATECG
jgi:RHS repeat-associated protein